jgi:hypothetical protein
MARSKRLGLIATMSVFSTILLSHSSYAQTLVTGTWMGTEYFNTFYYLDTTLLGESSGSISQAELTLQFFVPGLGGTEYPVPYVEMSLTGFRGTSSIPGLPNTEFEIFNTQQATGQTSSSFYHYGSFDGFFDVTYQSNFPDGFIDTDGGIAVASAFVVDDTNPFLGYTAISSVFFSNLPEPSSLALATSGLLAILVFAWMRGAFKSDPARRAPCAPPCDCRSTSP